ncbi:O-succinylhomoserine sulfhydrylase [uncultured Defluviicoccus sp.]|uniref:O-succinylhomoserine sulfhydrylase n=1 Tax=metagenome TaxID=256318 RepID=A0A380TGB1_9ZZZZ|nr:O-succinylhomoserine sulfhydrylase [uncultured Defluviicoccus sp.]
MTKDEHAQPGWKPATLLVRGGTQRSGFDETCEALFMTSGYVYRSAEEAERAFNGTDQRFVYSRFANPTVQMFEDRMALLEGAAFCKATASGMAAVFASMACFLKAGDRLVASRALFGSCQYVVGEILPTFGINSVFIDGTDPAAWRDALSQPTACVFLETPSNPMLDIIDVGEVAALAHAAGARLVVDNVFASPLLQKPFSMGADVVVYSATKHIDGQGRCLGGAVLANDQAWFEERLIPFLRHTGPALSPFNAWLLLKGLETLDLRMRRHTENALAIARHMEARGTCERLLYPGLASHSQHALAMQQMTAGGTIVTFDFPGDPPSAKAAAYAFLNALRIIDISNNLGDAKSLATHPATTTHQRLTDEERATLGIKPGTVRLSVGLEDAEDLIADIDQALDAAQALSLDAGFCYP